MILRAVNEISSSSLRLSDVQDLVLSVFREFVVNEGLEMATSSTFLSRTSEDSTQDKAKFCASLIDLLHCAQTSPRREESLLRNCLELSRAAYGSDDSIIEIKNINAHLAEFLFAQERFDEAMLFCIS
jgi:hypothetical protein